MTEMSRRVLVTGADTALAAPALGQSSVSRTLRVVPHASLTSFDPVWDTASITHNGGYLFYDTLYSVDSDFVPRPQIAAGHDLDDDGRLWTIHLREGPRFRDGEPVRARDVAASIGGWVQRDSFGAVLLPAIAGMRVLDDCRLTIRLHRSFPRLLDAIARPRPIFLRDEWDVGVHAAYARFQDYVRRGAATPGAPGRALLAARSVLSADRLPIDYNRLRPGTCPGCLERVPA